MSLANLSTPWFLAGLVAIAGALYLLQRLRVRHRVVTVLTTIFWHEAVEETRTRVLVRRFRHLPAYLLLLAIAGLIWLAAAEPIASADGDRRWVLLLDGSAGMSRGERFDEAADAVMRAAGRLPRERTEVLLCADRVRPLLRPGESPILLPSRLAGFRPQPAPATMDRVIAGIASAPGAAGPLTLIVFGDAPLRRGIVGALPDHVELRRGRDDKVLTGPGPSAGNRTVTALGVAEAASGRWDRVDVYLEILGETAVDPRSLRLDLDGLSLDVPAEPLPAGAGATALLLRDVPAGGGRLSVALAGSDAVSFDDEARIELPDRPLVRVRVAGDAAAPLLDILRSDPAVLLADDDPDVVIAGPDDPDDPVDPLLPTLRFVSPDEQAHAFLLTHDAGDDGERVLHDALSDLGLAQIDAMEMAQTAARTISIGAEAGDGRAISVWETLLGPEYDFARSRAFPLFIARSIRWLADAPPLLPFAAAGEPLPGQEDTFRAEQGRWSSSVGAPFIPPRAGAYRDSSGDLITVSLLDPRLAGPIPSPPDEPEAAWTPAGRRPGPFTFLVLAALAMLIGEWHLYRTGRIP